jgi:hypothetical protein
MNSGSHACGLRINLTDGHTSSSPCQKRNSEKTEVFVSQANAARILEAFFKMHGKPNSRNFQYLLNDQRRGRAANPIPSKRRAGGFTIALLILTSGQRPKLSLKRLWTAAFIKLLALPVLNV